MSLCKSTEYLNLTVNYFIHKLHPIIYEIICLEYFSDFILKSETFNSKEYNQNIH